MNKFVRQTIRVLYLNLQLKINNYFCSSGQIWCLKILTCLNKPLSLIFCTAINLHNQSFQLNLYTISGLKDRKDQPISSLFEEAHNFLSECLEKNGKIVVYINLGKSRSSAIIMSYIISKM